MTENPAIALAVFHQDLVDDFERAFECGVISPLTIQVSSRNSISLEQLVIDDREEVIMRSANCSKYTHNTTYRANPERPGGNFARNIECDVCEPEKYQTPCAGDVNVFFSSNLVATQRSRREKGWEKLLTDEDSIIGGLTFATWFLSLCVF